MITFVLPTCNNLPYVKLAYGSVRKYYSDVDIVILDDNSKDGTSDWLKSLNDSHLQTYFSNEGKLGHTILYDVGIKMSKTPVVGILHADMVIGPRYIENLLKHLSNKRIVCATRIEPPLHPPGIEKIVENFGVEFNHFNESGFTSFVDNKQKEFFNKTTKGIFAPWVISKQDFLEIGGHDPIFAPFPYEDSDLFQRLILNGVEVIQSWDSFVYHFTCRGHRWTEEIGKDTDEFKKYEERSRRNYLRKWGSWIKNSEGMCPSIPPRYNIGYFIKNCSPQILHALEPWCDHLYLDTYDWYAKKYIEFEQPNTKFNLSHRLRYTTPVMEDDIIVEFDANSMNQSSFQILTTLPYIIQNTNEIGEFEYDIFKIKIRELTTYNNELIVIN